MIDLHCHILPAIDDGARSLEEAVAMCRAAAADGCSAMIATPHQRRAGWWNCDRARLAELRRALAAAVAAELPRFQVLAGAEIRVDGQLLAEVEALAAAADRDAGTGVTPLAGSRYLLLELTGGEAPEAAADLVHELAVAGWRPILAHPEHIPWLAGNLGAVERLVALGALCQVTAMSITGDFGRRAQADTLRLIEAGLAHFVASDAHDLKRRPPGLSRARRAIAARWSEELAARLCTENPRAVLEDRPLPAGAAALAADAASMPAPPPQPSRRLEKKA
jgi:protein-tyrosine phosphatase